MIPQQPSRSRRHALAARSVQRSMLLCPRCGCAPRATPRAFALPARPQDVRGQHADYQAFVTAQVAKAKAAEVSKEVRAPYPSRAAGPAADRSMRLARAPTSPVTPLPRPPPLHPAVPQQLGALLADGVTSILARHGRAAGDLASPTERRAFLKAYAKEQVRRGAARGKASAHAQPRACFSGGGGLIPGGRAVGASPRSGGAPPPCLLCPSTAAAPSSRAATRSPTPHPSPRSSRAQRRRRRGKRGWPRRGKRAARRCCSFFGGKLKRSAPVQAAALPAGRSCKPRALL